jgi:PAS domain S-box-containing protein
MPSPRIFLGIGLAALVAISSASLALDVKSRSDAHRVNHTLEVLKKLSDTRLLLRHAESASRGFDLTGDRRLADEYRETLDQIEPALADLTETTRDNPVQTRLLEATAPLVTRRLAISSELVRRQVASDRAGMAAPTEKAEGRGLMESVDANFARLAAEEQRLLAVRSSESQRTGRLLLSVDIAGAALILILGAIYVNDAQRARRKQEQELHATAAANESLEATVAERTRHLVAAHEELRHSTSILQGTFTSMNEAVLVLDTGGKILLSNPAAERLLGYRSGMSIDQLWEGITCYRADGSGRLAAPERPAARAMRGEQFEGQEVILHLKDRRDPVHVVASSRALYDTSGKVSGAALVYHDITASRETERKLQQSQKLDAIGKLTGGVAHDFNNMLTVITGTTETLVASLQGQPELLRVAALIDQAAERCGELIRHLLAFARKQPLQPRNVDINATIEEISKLLRPTLGEQIEIRTALQPAIPTARIDPSQLANALLNLAINARDAMPNGGKLTLETGRAYLDEAYARQNEDVRPGDYVMIAVSDTGTGMPAGVLAKVFEPFFTTKEVGKGSGLGLSMVFGFVKQSNGHIKAYSEEGHGTTIKLYLPPVSGHADVAAPSLVPVSGGAETILVVEDDALVRNFAIAQLQSLGYNTVTAADSRAALALVDSDQPFDLLFTDLIMPGGMNGRQLADEVKRRRPGTKVLYTSGYTENAIVHHGRLDEGVILLTKPYRKSVLARMVRQALEAEATSACPGGGAANA